MRQLRADYDSDILTLIKCSLNWLCLLEST